VPAPPRDLPRKLGLIDLLAISAGNMIGAAIFVTPNIVAQSLTHPAWILGAWAFAGLLSLAGALTFAELGARMPETGGQYVYLRESFGPFWGFLFGWTMFVVIRSGGYASLAVAFAIYAGHFVPLSAGGAKIVAIATIVILAWINFSGVRKGALTQNLFTALKLAGLAAIVALASQWPGASRLEWMESSPFTLTAFGAALVPCLWAHQGWFSVPMVAGEAKNPSRNLPLSLGLSVVIVMAVYLAVNYAYMHLLSISEIASTERVASAAMQRAIGSGGAAFVSACALASILGAMNASIMAGPRVYFAQARGGLMPARLAGIDPKRETPAFAIWAQAIWSSILAATGSYELLITYSAFASWLFYGLTALGLILIRRKRPEEAAPYRVPGYPFTPILFAIVSFAFLANTFATRPVPSLWGILLIASGIPLYWLTKRRLLKARQDNGTEAANPDMP
jgi:APA family basic amino acid/polyamine antiporter